MSVRKLIPLLAAERGRSLADLSRGIGRNACYLQQFIRYGSPRRLPEPERRRLAQLLAVDERRLGAVEPWAPPAA